ncbi:MAG: O-antigen ligase family protein, partial [Patescibacteria group bacterium]
MYGNASAALSAGWYRIVVWGFAVLLLLPLLNIPPLFSPPAWGQTMVFRILFIPLFLVFAWQLTKIKRLSLFVPHGPAKIPWALLYALGGIMALATIFSIDPSRSFLDEPTRAWGAFNYLLYIGFTVTAFLALKTQEWSRLWYVLLGTGIGLSLLAVFQNLEFFSGVLISYGRPVATVGNPLFLAMFLVFLTLLGLAFLWQEQNVKRRAAIAAALLLFIYVIFITLSRAALLGLGAGAIFFLLAALPRRKLVKIGLGVAVLVVSLIILYANTHPILPAFLEQVPEAETFWYRLSVERITDDARFSAWEVAGNAIVQRPILGWGPSNAAIALDSFYDSTKTPLLASIGWWDTSHNIYIDFLLETGVLGLAIFLAFIASLLWNLQLLKRKKPNLKLQATGVQAAFFGYLVQGMFSFNTFATYLVFFFLVGYSFHLISASSQLISTPSPSVSRRLPLASIGGIGLISVLALMSIWFLFQHSIAPLLANKEMSVAVFQAEKGLCQQALQKAEGISSPSPSLNYYLPAQYTNIIRACLAATEDPQTRVTLALKAAALLDKAALARPWYSRTYLAKADYLNIVVSSVQEGEQRDALAREAEAALQKAQELSPKRAGVYEKWARTNRLAGNYARAVETAEQCIALNPENNECLWERALANVYMGNLEAVERDFNELENQRFLPFSHINQLAFAYKDTGHYDLMAKPYERLAYMTKEPKYAASLALTHKELGNWDEAHEAALLILKWDSTLRSQVEEFLAPIRAALQQECEGAKASACWRLSLVERTLRNEQEAATAEQKAEQLGFAVRSEQALYNLVDVYLANQDIANLIATHEKLLGITE